MAGQIFRQLPAILTGIRQEHRLLDQLIQEHHFDAIISDNRFGLWHKQVPCIYMTHQVMIKPPEKLSVLGPLLFRMHKKYINKFSSCWIPDYPGKNNLSGDLSHKYRPDIKTTFVGPLSRFQDPDDDSSNELPDNNIDLLAIISGPEPQRSIFERIILDQLKTSGVSAVVALGLPEQDTNYQMTDKISVFANLDQGSLKEYILNADHILCRPGYSSIMDLHALRRKATLVPTPGQTEQEYLARHLSRIGFDSRSQKDLNIKEILSSNTPKVWDHDGKHYDLLSQALDDLINKL